MAELHALLDDLREGRRPPLSVADVDALTGWLCGTGQRHAGRSRPDHDPVLLQMVFHRLDAALFVGGELQLAAAGLDDSRPESERRRRFRRLVSAFHPDRYPDLAGWLTERSQIVHRAYAGFKRGPGGPTAPAPPNRPPNRPPKTKRRRGGSRAAGPRRRGRQAWLQAVRRLRQRVGHDRHLAHKLVGGLALLALLPVLNVLLAPAADPGSGVPADHAASEAPVGPRIHDEPRRRDRDAADDAPSRAVAAAAAAPETELFLAARRAMTLDGETRPAAEPPSVDEQLAEMGLAAEVDAASPGRLEPVDAGDRSESEGGRSPAPGEASASGDASLDRIIHRLLRVEARAESGGGSGAGPTRRSTPLPPGQLILGPLASHPTGRFLQGLHADLDAGDIPGLEGRFAPDGRRDDLLGRARIGDHYRGLLARGDDHQANMRVRRLERDGDGWRVEVDVELRLRTDDGGHEFVRERAALWLTERDGTLVISRMRTG